jgi:predicted GNAT family N-acyltransferase
MSLSELTFFLQKWETTHSQITRMRKQVFMDEYHLPLNFLRHRDDEERYHVLAYDDLTGNPVATGCIHSDGHIGRIAILQGWREDKEVGHFLVDYLIHIARALKQNHVWVNAPIDNLEFFEHRNFFPIGDPFEYCGITMQKLELYLDEELYKKLH